MSPLFQQTIIMGFHFERKANIKLFSEGAEKRKKTKNKK